MTVCVALRLPGVGCAMAADSRIIDAHTMAIMSDSQVKFVVYPQGCVMIAGIITGAWTRFQAQPPKTHKAFLEALPELGDECETLSYHRTSDKLWYDTQTLGRTYAGIGAGSPIALGVLASAGIPKTLEEAGCLVQRSVEIAMKLNASCGGRVRVVVIPKRGAVVVK